MPLHFQNASAASEPGTNWETLLRKIFVIFIFVLPMFRYVSANRQIVFHQMFLNLVGNIFALREATFVSALKANVSRYGMQGNIRANIENHELISATMPVSLAKRL
jgi:hypothetical protein